MGTDQHAGCKGQENKHEADAYQYLYKGKPAFGMRMSFHSLNTQILFYASSNNKHSTFSAFRQADSMGRLWVMLDYKYNLC